ncbi:MAG: gliding motility-associated C-terminal domain-containing protein [Sphingobacteriales bacterium]|nr:gliding motility-associated C-terminal domain-containing protein [Sphingobacteriales bacterium]
MSRIIQHISAWWLLLFSIQQAMAQVAMPDTVCMGTTRIYKVNDASVPSSYTWKVDGVLQNSNRHEVSITWTVPGVYQLTVQEHANNGCDGDIRSGTVHVIPIPLADAGPDAVLCYGNTMRLSGSGGEQYQWSPAAFLSNPGSPSPLVTLPAAGTYTYLLTVSANGCRAVKPDTVRLTMRPPVHVFAGNDTSVAVNQPLQLQARDLDNSGFTSYQWTPSFGLDNAQLQSPLVILNSLGSRTYLVTARTADGCEARDDIRITAFARADIYVPTAFTPNGDGLNDRAVVIPVGIKELQFFSIFNRWGELVFFTKNPSEGWNGIYKGKAQDGNVFVWEAKGVDYNGNVIYKKGTVTLIR